MTNRPGRPATPVLQLLCPSCRAMRPCKPAGVATLGRTRREVVQCTADDCGLAWIPARAHLPAPPADAVPMGGRSSRTRAWAPPATAAGDGTTQAPTAAHQ